MKIGLNPLLRLFGYKMIKPYQDSLVYQHEYRGGYKEYKETQIFHNKRKLALVWADKKTLGLVADHLRRHNKQKLIAACATARATVLKLHGSTNNSPAKPSAPTYQIPQTSFRIW